MIIILPCLVPEGIDIRRGDSCARRHKCTFIIATYYQIFDRSKSEHF